MVNETKEISPILPQSTAWKNRSHHQADPQTSWQTELIIQGGQSGKICRTEHLRGGLQRVGPLPLGFLKQALYVVHVDSPLTILPQPLNHPTSISEGPLSL